MPEQTKQLQSQQQLRLQQELQQEMDDDPALVNIVYLDTISRKLTKLLDVSNNILQMNNQIFQTNNRILTTTNQLLQTDSQLLSTSNNILSTSNQTLITTNNILQKNDSLLAKAEEGLTKSDELLGVNNSILQKSNDILLTNNNILNTNNDILNEQKADADMGEYLPQTGIVTTTNFVVINTILDPGFPVKGYEIENTGQNDIYFAHNYIPSSVGADIADVTSTNTRFLIISPGKAKSRIYNRKEINNVYLLSKGGNSTYSVTLIW